MIVHLLIVLVFLKLSHLIKLLRIILAAKLTNLLFHDHIHSFVSNFEFLGSLHSIDLGHDGFRELLRDTLFLLQIKAPNWPYLLLELVPHSFQRCNVILLVPGSHSPAQVGHALLLYAYVFVHNVFLHLV